MGITQEQAGIAQKLAGITQKLAGTLQKRLGIVPLHMLGAATLFFHLSKGSAPLAKAASADKRL